MQQQRIRGVRCPRQSQSPSTIINRIETIRPGTLVVLWCRVSSGLQNVSGNNADQEADLRAAVEARGGIIVDLVAHAGRIVDAEAVLYRAANLAAQHGAVLLAESTSRFIRHPRYHPKLRPHLMPTSVGLLELRWVCGDVPLVTLLDPDATWQQERAHQSKRGQRRKGKPGGRPAQTRPGDKKAFRLRSLPKVRWMRYIGMSNRAIARGLGTDDRNVRRWGAAFLQYKLAGEGDKPCENKGKRARRVTPAAAKPL